MDVYRVIREKAVRPITFSALKQIKSSFKIFIKFEDDPEMSFKCNVSLKLWAVYIKNVTLTKISGPMDHCVRERLSFYKYLGFKQNEGALIRDENGNELPIFFAYP